MVNHHWPFHFIPSNLAKHAMLIYPCPFLYIRTIYLSMHCWIIIDPFSWYRTIWLSMQCWFFSFSFYLASHQTLGDAVLGDIVQKIKSTVRVELNKLNLGQTIDIDKVMETVDATANTLLKSDEQLVHQVRWLTHYPRQNPRFWVFCRKSTHSI